MLAPGITEIDSVVTAYRAIYAREEEGLVSLYPGAKETLQKLHHRGVRSVLVSNKGIDAILRSVRTFGLAPHLSLIVGQQDGIPQKPDPALFNNHLLKQLPDIDPARTLMIGDTLADIEFARNARLASCWASYGDGNHDECRKLDPDFQIDEISAVLAF